MASSTDSSDPKTAARPDLKIVEPGADARPDVSAPIDAPNPASAAPESPRLDPRPIDPPSTVAPSRLPWLLGLALVLSVILGLWQGQRVDRLTAEVDRLGAELEAVGAELTAHRAHLDVVRAGVDDLADQAQALSALAHADPTAPAAEEAAEAGPDGLSSEPADVTPDPDASFDQPAIGSASSLPGVVDF